MLVSPKLNYVRDFSLAILPYRLYDVHAMIDALSGSRSQTVSVATPSTKWKISTFGDLNSPPLLLLGYYPEPSWALEPLAIALSKRFYVIWPSHIEMEGKVPTFRNLAESVSELLESIARKRIIVLGVGFGGNIAAHLASARPDIVHSLGMMNSVHPDVPRADPDIGLELSGKFDYIADFLSPDYTDHVADNSYALLSQFWRDESWWMQESERYLTEFADKGFQRKTAEVYRANFHYPAIGGRFSSENVHHVSAFGSKTKSVQEGALRRAVAQLDNSEPLLIDVPTWYFLSSDKILPKGCHRFDLLHKFISEPRIQVVSSSWGMHRAEPDRIANYVTEFYDDVSSRERLAVEDPADRTSDRRDSQYIVDEYDRKIREFRESSIGEGQLALRGSHPKTHGVVRAHFVVEPDLPSDLQVGTFLTPTKYDCVMRFSSLGKPILKVFHDADRDVRGVGIKVIGGDANNPTTLHDFLLNTVPILSTKRGRDVVPQNLDFMNLEHLLQYADELVVPHVLDVSYYSQTPYRFGPGRAVKYAVRPQALPTSLIDDGVDRSDPNFLRRRLEHVLTYNTEPVVFDFLIQLQSDPRLDPIEDPRVEWRGAYVKVAEIRIPPQTINTPDRVEHDEAISFHLYHCPPAHAPLGAVNRSRRAVYNSSPHLRRKLSRLPQTLYPFPAQSTSVCVVGSGISGMSAALALAENGHKVTVVEERPNVGGHACSVNVGSEAVADPAFGSFTGAAYPNLQRLLHRLDVEYEELGNFREAINFFSLDGECWYKYVEDNPVAPHIMEEAQRFDAWSILEDPSYDRVTAREYFEKQGFSEEFIHYYFLGSVIFVFVGHPAEYYLDYPIRELVRYCYLPIILAGNEPVLRVKEGSGKYMERFRAHLEEKGVTFLTSTRARVAERRTEMVRVGLMQQDKEWEEVFDELLLTMQPPGMLSILGDKVTEVEKKLLEGVVVTHDTVVMHRDERFMPPEREQWRHGNIIVPDVNEALTRDRPFMFTKALARQSDGGWVYCTYAYNRELDVKDGKKITFDHVKVDPNLVRTRARIQQIQGQNSTWFAGSWLHAFTLHEHGLVTGLRAANGIMAGMQEFPVVEPFDLSGATKKSPWVESQTFLDVIEYQSRVHAAKTAMIFTDKNGEEEARMTYAQLLKRARRLATQLREQWGVKEGDRVLLVHPPGIDFVVAFVGTMFARAIPVPTYPPNPGDLKKDLPKISRIVEDCGTQVALTTRGLRQLLRIGSALSLSTIFKWPKGLKWHTTDNLPDGPVADYGRPSRKEIAFLQYTSGSTAEPKGVIISHGNMMHQAEIASEALGFSHETIGCCWVPQYHDLGLVGGIINSLFNGAQYIFTSPLSFLERPALWAEMLHKYRATATAAPDFGYRLLIRKTTPEQRKQWNLSTLTVAMSAGEPVDARTMREFTDAFAPCGVQNKVFSPAFGLAEHVVAVSMGGSRMFHADKVELQLNKRIRFGAHRLVGCGRPPKSVQVRIVDPETRRVVAEDEVGEIWVHSPSKSEGYWNRPDQSRELLQARLEGEDPNIGWLRTGDLGFIHHNEIFVTSRLKDMMILHGRNIYPMDIERAAESSNQELRPGCSAAFSVPGDEGEELILCAEVRDAKSTPEILDKIATQIRREVMKTEGLSVSTVGFLRPRSIPKTTSGKVRRAATRQSFLSKELDLLSQTRHEGARADVAMLGASRRAEGSSVEELLRAAVMDVTRQQVDPRVRLDEQVHLNSVEFLELVGIMKERFAVDLPVTILTQYPTLELLSQYIEQQPDVSLPDDQVVTLRIESDSGQAPLFLIHPARGGVECFLDLAMCLERPLVGIRQTSPAESIDEFADRYAKAIRSAQAEGPYLIGGYSFGATVCRRVASVLKKQGQKIVATLCIDEVHDMGSELIDDQYGDEIGVILVVARDYLTESEWIKLRQAARADAPEASRKEAVMRAVEDDDVRETILEQARTYQQNVRLLEGGSIRVDKEVPSVLIQAESSHHNEPEAFNRVYKVSGDHFSMLQRPNVEKLAQTLDEALNWVSQHRLEKEVAKEGVPS